MWVVLEVVLFALVIILNIIILWGVNAVFESIEIQTEILKSSTSVIRSLVNSEKEKDKIVVQWMNASKDYIDSLREGPNKNAV